MRKLLLTTAAALGAAMGFAGGAYAQSPAMGPYAPNAMQGVGGFGAPPMGASTFSPTPTAPAPAAAPNSFVVHLNGRINWYAGVVSTSADQVGPYKSDNLEFQGYIRLYPGFDAQASNGLQYGVVSEIRSPGAGGSLNGNGASGNSGANTLFWRRAYGYVGSAEIGQFHFGQGDGAFDLLYTGTFENFNDGAWDGDLPGFFPGAAAVTWPWPDVGNYYTMNRLVYMSPTWAGFQFGASFAPNNVPLVNEEGSSCSFASAGCSRLSSGAFATPGTVSSSPRFRNVGDVAAEYNGTFGGFGISASAGYLHATPVGNTLPGALGYQDLSLFLGGLQFSFAGFTVGGSVITGQMNGQYYLQPKGGTNAIAFLFGAEYASGPFIVGASYFKYQYTGDFQSPATEGVNTDDGIAAGGTYSVAPGLALYLSYLYGQRHQNGFNYISGAPNGTLLGGPAGTNNNEHGQAFSLGAVVKW